MFKDLLEKVKQLNLSPGNFAIFGSGPMGVRGIRECKDVDIIVTDDLFDDLSKNTDWESGVTDAYGDKYLRVGDIEIWQNWRPEDWDIGALIKNAEIIDGLPFVKLEKVLKWKEMIGRDKDKKDIELIRNYLRNN